MSEKDLAKEKLVEEIKSKKRKTVKESDISKNKFDIKFVDNVGVRLNSVKDRISIEGEVIRIMENDYPDVVEVYDTYYYLSEIYKDEEKVMKELLKMKLSGGKLKLYNYYYSFYTYLVILKKYIIQFQDLSYDEIYDIYLNNELEIDGVINKIDDLNGHNLKDEVDTFRTSK